MHAVRINGSCCIFTRSLLGSSAVRFSFAFQSRSAVGLSKSQWLRTLPQVFWRGEAAKLEGAVPGTPLIRDPYVQALVDALVPASELEDWLDVAKSEHKADLAEIEGVRCAFMDRFIMDSSKQRMRQVVLLGSGMDCRVFRLELPPQMKFVEVDEETVHEAKCSALEGTGARARCVVSRQAVSLDGGVSSADLVEVIQPVLNSNKATLFLIDGAARWPPESRSAALHAASMLAGQGSVIVGPAPPEDVAPALKQAGFEQVNVINHHQLSKIYRREVPESMKMLVAIHGPAHSTHGGNGGSGGGGGCGGKGGSSSGGGSGDSRSRAKEIKF